MTGFYIISFRHFCGTEVEEEVFAFTGNVLLLITGFPVLSLTLWGLVGVPAAIALQSARATAVPREDPHCLQALATHVHSGGTRAGINRRQSSRCRLCPRYCGTRGSRTTARALPRGGPAGPQPPGTSRRTNRPRGPDYNPQPAAPLLRLL